MPDRMAGLDFGAQYAASTLVAKEVWKFDYWCLFPDVLDYILGIGKKNDEMVTR